MAQRASDQPGQASEVFTFGSFTLDPALGLVQGPAGPVRIGHRAFNLLKTLVERRGEVISKAELLQAGWAGLVVEENNLPAQMAAIRRGLASEPGARDWIVTVSRTGYRFVGEVQRHARTKPPATSSEMLAVADETIRRLLPAEPEPPEPIDAALAVMPFANRTEDTQQDYFALGMTDEIVTALSRVPWLTVIAYHSASSSEEGFDTERIGRALGVPYLLRGSIAASGGHVRIHAQLIRSRSGAQVWADRFDGELRAIFKLQEEVALAVAGAIGPAVRAVEIRRATERPIGDLSAYDLYLRALPHVYNGGAADYRIALDLLGRALALDGEFTRALGLASICHLRLYREGWSQAPEDDRRLATLRAERALIGGHPEDLVHASYVLGHLGHDIGAMLDIMDRAIQLSPSFARGWYLSGVLRNLAGQPEIAIEHLQRSMRLDPQRVVTGTLGAAYMFAGDFQTAARLLARGIQEAPNYPGAYRFLASCLAHMERLEEARAIIERVRTITPVLIPNATHYRDERQRELFLSGLRRAVAQP